jgi:hypothetical protein
MSIQSVDRHSTAAQRYGLIDLTLRVPPDAPYGFHDYGFKIQSSAAQQFSPPISPPVWPLNLEVVGTQVSAECDTMELTIVAGANWASVACRATLTPGIADTVRIVPRTEGIPVPSTVEHRTSVSSLQFGPEGGTQTFHFLVRGSLEDVGAHPVELLVTSDTGGRQRGTSVSFMIHVVAPAPPPGDGSTAASS